MALYTVSVEIHPSLLQEISRLTAEVQRLVSAKRERESEHEEAEREKWTLQAALVEVSGVECQHADASASSLKFETDLCLKYYFCSLRVFS